MDKDTLVPEEEVELLREWDEEWDSENEEEDEVDYSGLDEAFSSWDDYYNYRYR